MLNTFNINLLKLSIMEKKSIEVEQANSTCLGNNLDNETITENQSVIGNYSGSTFVEGQVYSLSDYIDKIVVEIIESNRKEEKLIADKLKSCEANGMLVPGVFVDSKISKEAGYSVKPIFGTPDGRKPHYTVMEGNSRINAYLKALEKKKKSPDYKVFNYQFIYKKFDNSQKFMDAYRNMNICNVPTKTKDFVRDLLATGENKILSSYNEKIKRKLSAKASGFATVNQEIMKRDIRAIFNDKLVDYLRNDSILEFTTPVYNAVLKAFGCESGEIKTFLRSAVIWKFNAGKFNEASDKKVISDKLVKFYGHLSSVTTSNILTAKKTVKETKEQVIMKFLETEYKQQNENP